jgi:hypothetical protein
MFSLSNEDDDGTFGGSIGGGWDIIRLNISFLSCFVYVVDGAADAVVVPPQPSESTHILADISSLSSSKLASLFGHDKASFSGGNESLKYTAPKQPKKDKPGTCSSRPIIVCGNYAV